MSTQFLENEYSGRAFCSTLNAAIKKSKSIDIAVSYLQMSGWFLLRRELVKIPAANVRILTTDQMNITQPAALESAMRAGFNIKCYSGSRVFHPKVYLFHGFKHSSDTVIVGSANMSSSGLQNGVEAGVQVADPIFFKRLVPWFDKLFSDPASEEIDDRFVKEYHKRWKVAARARVPLRRLAKSSKLLAPKPTAQDLDTLEDSFSTISLPVGTLGFDHAGNNIRNLSRLMDVLARFPQIGPKERSELHLLGFMESGVLSVLGSEARSSASEADAARLWCLWIKKTPDTQLESLNNRLRSFKRAATRFWCLKSKVRNYFLRELANPDERQTLQAIELLCNGSEVVESLSIDDFKAMAPSILSGSGCGEFIQNAVTDYLENKGSRSWTSDDRRTVLNAWR